MLAKADIPYKIRKEKFSFKLLDYNDESIPAHCEQIKMIMNEFVGTKRNKLASMVRRVIKSKSYSDSLIQLMIKSSSFEEALFSISEKRLNLLKNAKISRCEKGYESLAEFSEVFESAFSLAGELKDGLYSDVIGNQRLQSTPSESTVEFLRLYNQLCLNWILRQASEFSISGLGSVSEEVVSFCASKEGGTLTFNGPKSKKKQKLRNADILVLCEAISSLLLDCQITAQMRVDKKKCQWSSGTASK